MNKTYYDGQLGAGYAREKLVPRAHKSCENATYDENSALYRDRQADEAKFNEKNQKDAEHDLLLNAVRSLSPLFSLFVVKK